MNPFCTTDHPSERDTQIIRNGNRTVKEFMNFILPVLFYDRCRSGWERITSLVMNREKEKLSISGRGRCIRFERRSVK